LSKGSNILPWIKVFADLKGAANDGSTPNLSPSGKEAAGNKATAAESLSINVFSLITKRSSVAGWYSGTAKDSQDTLEFSALSGVHPMIEKYPLDQVAEAYEQMHSGKVRFRVVLTMA
jgi:D-arabinose 1-dehydrogenase-like Zn-dependent alcohol dehydrogenase